ncbi:MAG: DNA-protecting protein DprA [Candidatus Taylorbacteria bacterium]|nr:DNA-protecting protein DprA [Candidatus Taylorbacteria bacterium]
MLNKSSIRVLEKKDWPEGLLQIPQPPKKLYIEGVMPSTKDNKFLCVVGSRKYSSYGKEICEQLIEGLRGYPIVIVSGLANGIDSIAHNSALRAGLTTVSLPGSGLSRKALYPQTNKSLADKIISAGGALLSQYEPDFNAMLHTFPERNRLMVALSQAVLIIEASQKSGTLITARLATEYNKDVLTIPGSIYSKTSEGPHMLLKQGARLITSAKDLLEALGFEQATDGQKMLELNYKSLTEEEKKLIKLIREPIGKDELIRISGRKPDEINSLLCILELKGIIKEMFGEIHLSV